MMPLASSTNRPGLPTMHSVAVADAAVAPEAREPMAAHAALGRLGSMPGHPTLVQLQPIKENGREKSQEAGNSGEALTLGLYPCWANSYPAPQSQRTGQPPDPSSGGVAVSIQLAMGLDLACSTSPHVLDGPDKGQGPGKGGR